MCAASDWSTGLTVLGQNLDDPSSCATFCGWRESCNVNNTSSDVEFNLGIPNSYGRPILKPERIKIEHDKIVKDFLNHFSGLWYLTKEPVWINSWIDETVYFIWAPISVLKSYIF